MWQEQSNSNKKNGVEVKVISQQKSVATFARQMKLAFLADLYQQLPTPPDEIIAMRLLRYFFGNASSLLVDNTTADSTR